MMNTIHHAASKDKDIAIQRHLITEFIISVNVISQLETKIF